MVVNPYPETFTDVEAPPALTLLHPSPRGYLRAKRVFDVFLACVLAVALSPIWLAAALAVRLTSEGPVLYRQTRVGQNGATFTCYKFRTMVHDAEERRLHLVSMNEASGPVFKIRRDPRLTRVGSWLRKSSIDELPQLWNVLRGEMSLVGPRPPLPEEVATYTSYQMGRLTVPPGLTCLWQVSGRSTIGFDEWVELDMQYIRQRSFLYDLLLILLTIPAVLTGRGAF
jgi:lipopolysaccharide/colanic/teichoic acid biosynthesis glycosyltransferase